ERRTPPATSADRFSICSPSEHNGNIWPAVNRFQQALLLPLGAPEPTGGALSPGFAEWRRHAEADQDQIRSLWYRRGDFDRHWCRCRWCRRDGRNTTSELGIAD